MTSSFFSISTCYLATEHAQKGQYQNSKEARIAHFNNNILPECFSTKIFYFARTDSRTLELFTGVESFQQLTVRYDVDTFDRAVMLREPSPDSSYQEIFSISEGNCIDCALALQQNNHPLVANFANPITPSKRLINGDNGLEEDLFLRTLLFASLSSTLNSHLETSNIPLGGCIYSPYVPILYDISNIGSVEKKINVNMYRSQSFASIRRETDESGNLYVDFDPLVLTALLHSHDSLILPVPVSEFPHQGQTELVQLFKEQLEPHKHHFVSITLVIC